VLGLGFGEILVLVIVGIVVVGPRRLPALMRTAGQWVARLRNMSSDLRAQSGLDDLIREEGLTSSLEELRSMSRVNVLDTFAAPITPTRSAAPAPALAPVGPATAGSVALAASSVAAATTAVRAPDEPLRDREYPLVGCDAYDALPDDVLPYMEAPLAAVPYGADASDKDDDARDAPEAAS
jgi:sec-independent protein translocase protein TatB